jgi:hypothetical protein
LPIEEKPTVQGSVVIAAQGTSIATLLWLLAGIEIGNGSRARRKAPFCLLDCDTLKKKDKIHRPLQNPTLFFEGVVYIVYIVRCAQNLANRRQP